jgi:hypothetical protein
VLTAGRKSIKPKTLGQKRYVDAIRRHTVVFGIGPAGTGKTYALGVARHAWQLEGYRVLGAAPTGIATVCLDAEGFEHSRTVDALLAELDQERTAATLTLACIGLLVLRLVELPLTPARRALLAAMAAGLAGLLAVPWLREFFALSLPPAQPLLLALAMVAVVGVGMELIVRRSG